MAAYTDVKPSEWDQMNEHLHQTFRLIGGGQARSPYTAELYETTRFKLRFRAHMTTEEGTQRTYYEDYTRDDVAEGMVKWISAVDYVSSQRQRKSTPRKKRVQRGLAGSRDPDTFLSTQPIYEVEEHEAFQFSLATLAETFNVKVDELVALNVKNHPRISAQSTLAAGTVIFFPMKSASFVGKASK